MHARPHLWPYPYGEAWYETDTPDKWKFTTYERDLGGGESGNDYAMFRTYVNRLGRFNAPDPIAGSIADPQTLNRYAYVLNDPVNLVDPLGLTDGEPCGGEHCLVQDVENARLSWFLFDLLVLAYTPTGWVRVPYPCPNGDCRNPMDPADYFPVFGNIGLLRLLRQRRGGGEAWRPRSPSDGPDGEERVLAAGLGSVLRYVARNLRIEGPSPGFAHGRGRAFGIRWGSLSLMRLDLHPLTRGVQPIWHVHLFARRGQEHGIRIPLQRP